MRLLFAACLLPLILSSGSFAQIVTVDYHSIGHAVLIAPGDSRFEPLRDDILKAAGTNDSINEFKNIGVLLQNKSPEPILGYAISWEVANAAGEISRFNLIWWQKLTLAAVPGEAESKDPSKVQAALMVQVAAPGESRLISPFFNISRQSNIAKFGTTLFSGPPHFSDQVLKAVSIKVTLDSVVYGDGLCEGEDTLNLCDSINGQLDGMRSLFDAVQKLKADGLTQQEILDKLSPTAGGGIKRGPSRRASHEEWADYAKAMLAEDVARIRDKSGDDRAMEEINRSKTSFRVHR